MDSELSRVVDALPGLVWTALPDGHVDFLNQRWCEYTSRAIGESYGWGWQEVVHPEDLSALCQRWRSILVSGEPGEMEARLRRFDGEYRWFLFRASPMANASGNLMKWCGTATDIEDHKRAEQALNAPGGFSLLCASTIFVPSPTILTHSSLLSLQRVKSSSSIARPWNISV
jgi:PAS domain S-box-containing protein